jgi:hypothetical protein
LDGDGFADFVSVRLTGNVVWYKGNGDGTFSSTATTILAGSSNNNRCAKLADMDGDGDLDVLIPSVLLNKAGLHWNNAGVISTTGVTLATSTQMHDIEAGDLDNDGDLDILWTSFTGSFCSLCV